MESRFESFDVSFKHPYTLTICGASQSGKTCFIKELIKSDLNNVKFERIIWCYGASNNVDIPGVELVEGLDFELHGNIPTLVVIDDLMTEAANSSVVLDLFTKKSHHNNCSVILITQNFYFQGRYSRTISQNSHYIVLLKSPRDSFFVSVLGRQMYPNNSKFLVDAYKSATAKAFSHLFLDLKQETPDFARVRSSVLSPISVVYLP